MTIQDVAEYLDLNEQTVYRMVQQRKIPAVKIGGQWKVKRSHIDKMFDDVFDDIMRDITPK